ncbi:hypothetical protein AB3X94_33380 [Paraburkholderia sp. BR10923]|uniref:hypothetical protein n=1 Tax=Paraburkholderia TaxID=1822464 RepID=UPI001590F7F2|nr:hypothetical protein [Paraburkholderia youngii]NUX51878.1 hypothetical protein [Paraburkholderia youngii]
MKHALSSAWRGASLLSGVCLAAAMLDAAAAQQNPAAAATSPKASPYMPVKVPQHAQQLYQMMHGVDNLSVRRTASGNLLRFSYRVTDPAVAQLLGDKNSTPYLYGERSHALLEVPVMDTIGQLRQTGPQEVGQQYWVVFSNKGNLIRAGDRVNVLIGTFHIDGLVVE